VGGEIPADLLESIIGSLAREQGVPPDSIEVERAEYVIWPDGALGCPRPDEMYTQAQVPGYWVVLRVGQSRFDYRATAKGHFRRCSNSLKRQLPVG